MEISELRVFVAVAEELHFGRAAQRLHLAQPPVSRTVRQLEDELGQRLFDRSTRSVSLTAAGIALLEPAREVLAAHRRAELTMRSAARGSIGTVRVVYAGASTQAQVGALAQEVRNSAPDIALDLIGSTYGQAALDLVMGGDAEVALGRWEVLPARLASKEIHREQLVVAVPEADPLSARSSVALAELADSPFVTLPAESLLVARLQRDAAAAGFTPRVAQVAPDSATLIALVRAGAGYSLTVSTVPPGVSSEGVRFLPLAEPGEAVVLRMAWRADRRTPALDVVIKAAERLWPGDPAADAHSATAEHNPVLDDARTT